MSFDAKKPYNKLPDILPPEKFWKTNSIYESVIAANRSLAELKGRLSAIPNPNIFINTLTLQEAKDSSSIENIFTTNDKLFRAFTITNIMDLNTKEVLRYGKALTDAFKNIKTNDKFSIEVIESIYKNITDEKDVVRDIPVYIGNRQKVIYTPPCCKDILMKKLDNWIYVANLKKNNIDPLVKMAILHYQFEAIHPFKDGMEERGGF